MSRIDFLLNGEVVHADNPPPHMTLLDFLRFRGLTGAKEGCAEGECGACAVACVEDGESPGRSAYRAVNSCLMFLPMAAGREILTVESLADAGELHEVQEAMAAGGGSQCGYCTPGFVMSIFAEQYRPDRAGACDPMAMAGNLCRCTGYRPIRDAALSLGPAPRDAFRARLDRPAPELVPMSSPGFSRPGTVAECLSLLRQHPGGKLIGGGTDLAVESNVLYRRWPHLVSVDGIAELRGVASTADSVIVGCALPLSDIARRWADAPPVFHEWLALFGSPLIRNRATFGGNLATASPVGDAAPLLLALDALVHVTGAEGLRIVPLASFFKAYRRTAMLDGEILTAVEIPKPLPQFVRFYKIAKRPLDDITTVSAAMALDVEAGGRVRRARLAFGGVAATPIRIIEAEAAITGQPWNDAAVERVQQILDRTLQPMSDQRGSKEYRLEVAKSLVERFQWEQRHQ